MSTAAGEEAKRIAVVGAGAVGSYYGGRIWESLRNKPNADVMFHLRNEHYDYCSKHGIDGKMIRGAKKCFHAVDNLPHVTLKHLK